MNELLAKATKKRLLSQFYNKCHSPDTGHFCEDPTHEHSKNFCKACPEDEKKLLKNLDPGIKPLIAEMLTERREVEPEYTDLLLKISKEQGGEMIGLDSKFKKAEGVIEKIDRKIKKKGLPPEAAAKDIVDSLRYTMSFAPDKYTEGVRTAVQALAKKGIKFDSMENNWSRGDAYNGINAIFRDTSTGLKIELQFHTPESFNVKDRLNHDDYVFNREGRGTPAQRLVRHERMRQRADAVTFPKNIDELSSNIAGVKVTDLFRPNVDTLLTIEKTQLLRF